MSVLAVDLGGSALKACLFDEDAKTVAHARVDLSFDETRPGWSEAHPSQWWEALKDAVERIGAAAGNARKIREISICGFTRTQVFLDANLYPVRAAIGFRDRRATEAGETMRAKASADHLDLEQFNGFHPLARLLWLRDYEPENWHRTRYLVEPKDFLNLKLTGAAMSDEVSHYWLAKAFEGGANSLASLCGIDREVLPRLDRPHAFVGRVSAKAARELPILSDASVVLGSNDTWSAVAGMEGLTPGRAYCVSGSSEVMGMVSGREAHTAGLATVRWGADLWQIGGPGQNGSNTVDWANTILSREDGQDVGGEHSPRPLIFLPYLLGERTPYWDAELRGALLGLDADTHASDIRRAVMEGVAYVNRTVLERAEAAVGHISTELRIGGGGARSPAWNQIRADVLGRTVLAATEPETGLAGCLATALAARIGSDGPSIHSEGRQRFVRYDPSPDRRDYYDELFRLYGIAHDALAPISRQLTRMALRSPTHVNHTQEKRPQ